MPSAVSGGVGIVGVEGAATVPVVVKVHGPPRLVPAMLRGRTSQSYFVLIAKLAGAETVELPAGELGGVNRSGRRGGDRPAVLPDVDIIAVGA